MTTEMTRGHTYDDIEEFDNRLPNWWLWTFYLACIFSVLYWIHYHTLGTGNLPIKEYELEQKAAAADIEAEAARNPITEESLMALSKNPAIVEEGRKIFQNQSQCAKCHKADATGNVGPNLTDEWWIYGDKAMDIFTTVSKGRLPDGVHQGGMPQHESNGSQFVQRVVAYVLTLKGKNLPGKPHESYAKKVQ